MRLHAAVVLAAAALAVLTGQAHAVNVIGLSGDDTRHGIVTLYGDWRSAQEGLHTWEKGAPRGDHRGLHPQLGHHHIEVARYHVDTLVQTRFAHTKVDVEIRNNNFYGKHSITVPFAIPQDAMLTQFIVETDGKEFQARPVLREEINVDFTSSSATITAHDAESFDVTMELVQGGIITLRLEYEQLLARHLGRYRNVQQIWPGTLVRDMRIGVRIKEATDITGNVTHFVTAELPNGAVVTVDAEKLDQLSNVTKTMSVVAAGGVREVAVTFQPSEQEQRELANLLSRQADQGVGGQFNVQYEVERHPTAGDIVVRDGYFAHFFAPSGLKTLPKYAIFLLDVSSSMNGNKLTQLKDALKAILGQLGPDDVFTVIEFASHNEVWSLSAPSLSATCNAYGADAVPKAQARADLMTAKGSTALLGGMRQSLECARRGPAGLEPILLVLTDGRPNEPLPLIISSTARWNNKGHGDLVSSVFTLAFGASAKLDFLKELAARNGGSARQIYDSADASSQLQDFYASIASPLLKDVSVTFDHHQVDQATLTQRVFRTYFRGSELVVAGKLLGDALTGTVTGLSVGGKVSYPIKVTAQPEWKPERLRGIANSERLWAFLFTSQQLDQAALDGKNSAAAEVATDMALKHSFVTTFNCLALDLVNPYSASTPAAPTLPPTSTTSTTAPTTTTTKESPTTTTAAPTTSPASPAPHPNDDGKRGLRLLLSR